MVHSNFPGINQYHRVSVRNGRSILERYSPATPNYILCTPAVSDFVLGLHSGEPSAHWKRFFATSYVEAWEEVGRHGDALPIWHGLTDAERAYLLSVVRENISHRLRTGESFSIESFPQEGRLNQSAFAAVSAWCGGEMRGCMLAFEHSCLESVIEASTRMLSDSRYRALDFDELPDVRFEVAAIFDLGIPVVSRDWKRNDIYVEKAYRMQTGARSAWYLPEVLNSAHFSDLTDFSSQLARKGGFSSADAHVEMFEVDDFIESAGGADVTVLSGPVPVSRPVQRTSDPYVAFSDMFEHAADHLKYLVQERAVLPKAVDPFDVRTFNTVSLGRCAFTMHGMLTYAQAVDDAGLRQAGERLYEKTKLLYGAAPVHEQLLMSAYLGMAARDLGRVEDTKMFRETLLRAELQEQEVQPIPFLQTARFFLSDGDTAVHARGAALCERVLAEFSRAKDNGTPISLAEYADLLVVTRQLGAEYRTVGEEISRWYESYQHDDGSFPNYTTGGLPYTRGTSKILESLAYDAARREGVVERALGWLARMQYAEDSMFFVPASRRHLLRGGFRHDVCNMQAWPDAAGHVLVGAARLAAVRKVK